MESHRQARMLFLCVLVVVSLTEGKTVKFKLYSGSYRGTYTVKTVKYVPSKYFSSSKTTYFVIHGWKMNAGGMDAITRELAKRGEPVFAVDWNDWAKNVWYPTACINTAQVGSDVASFIRSLEARTHARREKMHVIGFSLGGKVSAATAAKLGRKKLMRITGLDTPLYCVPPFTYPRLDTSDATFVDTIRTTLLSGTRSQQQGHADFWTCLEKGCVKLDIFHLYKLHVKVVNLFANSINKSSCRLAGKACSKNFWGKLTCNGERRYMGFGDRKPTRNTMYYVSYLPSYCKNYG